MDIVDKEIVELYRKSKVFRMAIKVVVVCIALLAFYYLGLGIGKALKNIF